MKTLRSKIVTFFRKMKKNTAKQKQVKKEMIEKSLEALKAIKEKEKKLGLEHSHISQKDIINAYKKKGEPGQKSFLSSVTKYSRVGEGRKIAHLSSRQYEISFNNVYNSYDVWNEKTKKIKPISIERVQPKSVREKLHNIETAKAFYEQAPKNK